MRMKAAILGSVLAAALTTPALADRHCGDLPDAEWMSVVEVATIATEAGYTVREVERDDGCYELKVVDGQGQRFEIDIHPGTGEIVKIERD